MDNEESKTKLKDAGDNAAGTNVTENRVDGNTLAVKEETNVGSVNAISENQGAASRRASASIDDDDSKRAKRRKGDNDHIRKDDYGHKKDEHGVKKDDCVLKNKSTFGSAGSPKLNAAAAAVGVSTASTLTATTTATTLTAAAASSSSSSVAASAAAAATSAVTMQTTTPEISENEDAFKCADSPGPKVPPLKIVIPPVESEQNNKNGKTATRHHGGLPYVVVSNDETGTTSPSSPATNQSSLVKDEDSSNVNLSNEEQRLQQRVLRSTHSNRISASNAGNANMVANSSGSNNDNDNNNGDGGDDDDNKNHRPNSANNNNVLASDSNSHHNSNNTNQNVNANGGHSDNNNNSNVGGAGIGVVGSGNVRDSFDSSSSNNNNNNNNNNGSTVIGSNAGNNNNHNNNNNNNNNSSATDAVAATTTATTGSIAASTIGIVASTISGGSNTTASFTNASNSGTTGKVSSSSAGVNNINNNNSHPPNGGSNSGRSSNNESGGAAAAGGNADQSSSGNSSETSGNSSPMTLQMSPSHDVSNSGGVFGKEECNNAVKSKADSNSGVKNSVKIESGNAAAATSSSSAGIKIKTESNNKTKTDAEDDSSSSGCGGGSSGGTSGKSGNNFETRGAGAGAGATDTHNKDAGAAAVAPVVDVHPRKRKLKSKQEIVHATSEADHALNFGSAPHPHEVPVTNCYQMYMDIRRQIDIKRKGLFPIQPKPPQGFKDYLMNRCTYTLAGNSIPRLKRRNAEPPEAIDESLKDLYQEQEAERYSLRMQHVVEKEKLVLSVEQEILRVHGRAARALANQALPFSACTILKDEEVYNVITPEQEEKDRNARSRYNGRLFISWLQDVDDKWEKIKEEMLARHHKEAESLNAVQKFNWDLKMRQLGLWKKKKPTPIDESHVPMISVSDDFDLLPE